MKNIYEVDVKSASDLRKEILNLLDGCYNESDTVSVSSRSLILKKLVEGEENY